MRKLRICEEEAQKAHQTAEEKEREIAEVMKKGEGSTGVSDGKIPPVSSHLLLSQVPMGPPHKRPHSESETHCSPPSGELSSNPESPRKRYKGDDSTKEDLPDIFRIDISLYMGKNL